MREELKFHALAVRKDELQRNVLSTISANNNEVSNKLELSLQKQEAEEKLKIAFVGQHNAGKSTIVSALTGNKQIKISGNVETDVASDYVWEGVLLTDTPGLYAGKKEEHDAISLQKIRESDLLVFCITSSLFDNLLIKNFVELAYKQAYKSKIFIVINKMSQESGDFEQLVENYTESLTKTLEEEGGYFGDFPVSFIDAQDFIEGIEDSEPELVECSNFDKFVNELNNFISNKKLFAKLETPCHLMIDAIDEETANTSTELDRNMMTLLRQSESVMHKYKKEFGFYIHDAKQELRNAIMAKANNLISRIGTENIQEDEIEKINEEIKNLSEHKISEIEEYIENEQLQMINDVGEVLKSDLGNFVLEEFNNNKVDINIPANKDFSNFSNKWKQASDVIANGVKNFGDKVVNMAGGVENLSKIDGGLRGTPLHQIIYKTGKKFGHKFYGKGAVKLTSKIGKTANYLSKGIGPALQLISLGVEIGSKVQQDQQIKKIQDTKRDTFNKFSSLASDIISNIEEQFKTYEVEVFDEKTNEIENIRKSLIENNRNNSDYINKLKEYREDLCILTEEISKA